MIALTLYRLLWVIAAAPLAVVSALHPRLRGAWFARWGLSHPRVEPGAIAVHGASVGEGVAAEGVFAALRAARPRRVLLRLAFTDTGLASARGHDALAALPFDAPWVVGPWLDRLRPRALVLVESELWPNLLAAAARRGIPVAVVGAQRAKMPRGPREKTQRRKRSDKGTVSSLLSLLEQCGRVSYFCWV